MRKAGYGSTGAEVVRWVGNRWLNGLCGEKSGISARAWRLGYHGNSV